MDGTAEAVPLSKTIVKQNYPFSKTIVKQNYGGIHTTEPLTKTVL
jgi:hypothetical protein